MVSKQRRSSRGALGSLIDDLTFTVAVPEEQQKPMSGTNSPRIKREYLKAAQGTKGSWAGFLPPHIFINRYMSTPGASLQESLTESYASVRFPSCTGEDDEDHIEAFLNVIRDSSLCSDTVQLHVMGKVVSISLSSMRDGKCAVKTPAQKRPATRHQGDNTPSSSTSPSITKSTGDTTDNSVSSSFSWHQPGLFIEFAKNGDPFYDTPADWKEHRTSEKDDFRSAETRGKLALYAREAFYHQHRTHLFQLLIFGDEVRFIRWDRAGASLSHKFNFVENPEPLKNFFSVYGRMKEIARGWDSTVTLATPQEEQLYQIACAARFSSLPPVDAVRMAWETMPAMDLSSTWDESWPTYRITLDLVDGLEERDTLIVKRPFYHVPERIVGRTARAYLAYSMKLDRLVFFKDGWRKDSKRYVAEAVAYGRLRRYQVAYTPETLAGGDVRGNTTRTNELIRQIVKRPEGSEQVLKVLTDTPLRQHQIVQELACPLQYLPSTKDVVGVIRDCYIAILQASHAGLLHRDISVANIMARYNVQEARWEGILNDWDMCGLIKTYFDRISTRVGTWNYLSIENLQDPSKQHNVMDELQSLFWVLLYAVAVYFNPSAQLDLAMFLEQHTSKIDGREQQVAGRMKLEFLKDDKIQPFLRDVKSKSLEWLLVTMTTHWKEYYLLKVELAREEIKGVHNALCLAQYLTGVSQVASAKQVDAAKLFARKHALVSDPQFWINMCNKAIDIDSWVLDAAPEKPKTSRRKKEGEVATAMAKEMRVILVDRPTTTTAKCPDDEQDAFSHLGQVTGGGTASGSGREGQHSSPNKRSREAIDTDPQIGALSLSAKKPRPVTCPADAQQHQEIHEVSYAESRLITKTDGERLAAEVARQADLNLSKGSILDSECDVDGDSGAKLVDSLKMNGELGKTLP